MFDLMRDGVGKSFRICVSNKIDLVADRICPSVERMIALMFPLETIPRRAFGNPLYFECIGCFL